MSFESLLFNMTCAQSNGSNEQLKNEWNKCLGEGIKTICMPAYGMWVTATRSGFLFRWDLPGRGV